MKNIFQTSYSPNCSTLKEQNNNNNKKNKKPKLLGAEINGNLP